MKLWFKIFISTLFLVIAMINITVAVILTNNRSLMISRERSRAVSSHEFICATLKNNVAYERLRSDKFIMSKNDIDGIVKDTVLEQSDDSNIAIIYDKKNEIARIGKDRIKPSELLDKIKNRDNIFSQIKDINRRTYILVASKVILEKQEYFVVTSNDMTEIYTEGARQLQFAQMISVFLACITAVILLIMIKLFLRPLNEINKSINEISNGNYSKRLKIRGSEELRGLSENINIMAGSIEENYKKIKGVADERKRFIDSLAHEIKTPLTSILGFADILRIKKNISSEEISEYSGIIVEEAKRLRALSGKLMELISTGNNSLELKPVNTENILGDLKIVFVPIVQAKGIELMVECEPLIINADEDIFKSLIYNILDNAVKASGDGGKIYLSCKRDGDYAVISVKDNGIGISEEDKEHIFEAFYMADKSRSRKQGGAGIGLALCAEIAEKHNAVITLESTLGKGTNVQVRIKTWGGKIEAE